MRPLPPARLWPSPRPRARRPALLNHDTRAAAVATRQSPCAVLPNLRILRPSRTKDHESRIRQPACLPCPRYNPKCWSMMALSVVQYIHLRHQLANLISLSLARLRSTQCASSASLNRKFRCPLFVSVPLCITIPARHTHHRPCTTRQSQHGRDNFPSLVQSPEGLL